MSRAEGVLYFAYGSNMLSARLRERAPSARAVGAALLRGRVLAFHKRARDGSAKCDAAGGGDDEVVRGVLFEIEIADLEALDRAEGRGAGYERAAIAVHDAGGRARVAEAYFAQPAWIDGALLPYTWYRDVVAAGARQHGLPAEYVAVIAAHPAIADPDAERERRARRHL